MNQQNLASAIQKNLEIIKNEARSTKSGEEAEEVDPSTLIKDLPKANTSGDSFEFSANRLFFDDIYFRNSKLIRM